MSGIYTDKILEHYHVPRNYGLTEDFDLEGRGENPVCGDLITIRLKKNGKKVSRVSFEGEGCAISRASASILSEYVKGKTKKEIKLICPLTLPDILEIELSPARLKCAFLPLEIIQKILENKR